MNYQELDQKIAKKSNERLVISGKTLEHYHYENAYLYNMPPMPRKSARMDRRKNTERREDNVRAARQRIRRLISCNVNEDFRLKFITYTFAENVQTLADANEEWKRFSKKLREEYPGLKYLAVVEFQKRGAVHYHVLYFNMPFIYGIKEKQQRMWKNGFVKVIAIERVKSVAAYVSKYLQKGVLDARLCGEKAFFCSKGLVHPEETKWGQRIEEILSGATVEYEVASEYPSAHYGTITYKRGTIVDI